MGYEFSRFDSDSQISERPVENPEEDIYRHPSAHPAAASRFRKEFDVYSFGLILMEIAKWKPLKHIAKEFRSPVKFFPQPLFDLRVVFVLLPQHHNLFVR